MNKNLPAERTVKDALKAVLDGLNMGFPKLTCGAKTKTLVRKKSIKGGSCGPNTVTTAYIEKMLEVQRDVLAAFQALQQYGVEVVRNKSYTLSVLSDLVFKIQTDAKTIQCVTFTWEVFKTYAPSQGLDPSYKTYWFVMSTQHEKADPQT